MKKLTRAISAMMVLCLITTSLAACNSGSPSSSAEPSPESTPTQSVSTEDSAPVQTDYPTKPIQVIVPVKPGGGTDLSCRLTIPYLEKELGKNLVVVNVDGAGGSIGMTQAKDSDPDGYTVLYHQSDVIANSIMGVVDYSWSDALNVAGTVNQINNMALLVAGDAPYSTVQELVDYAKAQPKPMNLATEIGTDNQLFMMQFAKQADIKLNLVDLGGAAARVAAMKGKQIDVTCMPYFNVKDYVTTGDFKCIGVFADERSKFFPDVPTIKEQGLDITYSKFHLFAFPAGVPQEIQDKFSAALKAVCENPDYQKELGDKLAFEVMYKDSTEGTAFMKEIEDVYRPLAEDLTK